MANTQYNPMDQTLFQGQIANASGRPDSQYYQSLNGVALNNEVQNDGGSSNIDNAATQLSSMANMPMSNQGYNHSNSYGSHNNQPNNNYQQNANYQPNNYQNNNQQTNYQNNNQQTNYQQYGHQPANTFQPANNYGSGYQSRPQNQMYSGQFGPMQPGQIISSGGQPDPRQGQLRVETVVEQWPGSAPQNRWVLLGNTMPYKDSIKQYGGSWNVTQYNGQSLRMWKFNTQQAADNCLLAITNGQIQPNMVQSVAPIHQNSDSNVNGGNNSNAVNWPTTATGSQGLPVVTNPPTTSNQQTITYTVPSLSIRQKVNISYGTGENAVTLYGWVSKTEGSMTDIVDGVYIQLNDREDVLFAVVSRNRWLIWTFPVEHQITVLNTFQPLSYPISNAAGSSNNIVETSNSNTNNISSDNYQLSSPQLSTADISGLPPLQPISVNTPHQTVSNGSQNTIYSSPTNQQNNMVQQNNPNPITNNESGFQMPVISAANYDSAILEEDDDPYH